MKIIIIKNKINREPGTENYISTNFRYYNEKFDRHQPRVNTNTAAAGANGLAGRYEFSLLDTAQCKH